MVGKGTLRFGSDITTNCYNYKRTSACPLSLRTKSGRGTRNLSYWIEEIKKSLSYSVSLCVCVFLWINVNTSEMNHIVYRMSLNLSSLEIWRCCVYGADGIVLFNPWFLTLPLTTKSGKFPEERFRLLQSHSLFRRRESKVTDTFLYFMVLCGPSNIKKSSQQMNVNWHMNKLSLWDNESV